MQIVLWYTSRNAYFLKTVFFSKVFNLWKVLRSNLEETEKRAHQKMQKRKKKKFFGFSELF